MERERDKVGKILLSVTKTSSALLCIKYRFNAFIVDNTDKSHNEIIKWEKPTQKSANCII